MSEGELKGSSGDELEGDSGGVSGGTDIGEVDGESDGDEDGDGDADADGDRESGGDVLFLDERCRFGAGARIGTG